jgi:hypothetical protein
MSPAQIESAGFAWICCAADRALSPTKHANLYQLPKSMTFDEIPTAFIRRSEVAKQTND